MDWREMDSAPLDILGVSRAIAELWRVQVKHLECENGSAVRMYPRQMEMVYNSLVSILETYDQYRTEEIRLLRAQVATMQNVTPRPPFVIKKEGA